MTKSGKQILKYAAVIFISVFILFTGITAFFLFKSEKYLNEKLPVLIAERSDGLYHLSFRKIKLNPLSFTAVIYDVKLTPDKKISVKLMEKQEYPEVVYSFSCPEFRISRINFFSLIKHRKFDCSKIRAYKPVLEISGNTIFAEDKQPFAKIFYELRPLFSDLVKEINIKNIEFVEASYGFYSSLQDSVKSADARQISLEIKNFRTDSTKIFRLNDLFDSDDIIIRMNDFSNEMGDSLHWLHVETLQYSLKHSDIHAKGFHLYPTIKDRKSNLFEVNAPELYLKSKSVARFNFKDSLEIDFLSFKNPQIKFFQKENPKKLNIEDINNFDLYGLVKNQFLKIDVDTFHLSDARLEIYRQPDSIEYQQLFKNIDVILNGFALDSTSSKNPEKLLHADNLEMTISDYHLRLEDNEHDFIADSMFISTFSNSLGARKITIMPVKSGKIPPRTEVNISCMALNLEDVNLKTLYRTRKLPTQKINVINPDVHLTYNSEIVRKKETKDPGLLFNLVTAYLRGVYADSVTVSNGKLNIRNLTHNKIQGYFETDFDFNLAGFTLDSATIRNTDKFFYASDFDLEFLDYQMKLVDDLHKINVDRISIMNLERKVEIDNLHFQPAIEDVNDSVMQSFNRSELYNIAVPKIILHGINLRNAFFYNQLNITNFYISKPKIYFENFGLLREKKEQKEFSEFYQLIFNYITDFNIAKIEIPDGELTWVNHTRKGKTISFDNQFSAALYNFRLNESELNKKRLLFSDNFEITLKDQIFQLSDSVHILKAGEVNLSSERSAIEIKDALLYPMVTAEKYNKLPTTFQVTIPQFKISNINFQNAYYSKELALSELELNNPRFQVYSQQGKAKSLDLNKYRFPLPAFIKSLKIKQFKINQAEVLTYQIKGLQQNAKSNFKVNFQIPEVLIKNDEQNHIRINTGNLITSITGFKAPIGKNHDLRIEQIDFNRNDKTIFVNELKVN